MHSTVLEAQVWQRWRDARQVIVVEAFEDSITGARIKEFRQDLTQRLGGDCRVIEHVWLFNMFRLRELREIAAEEAATADLIVIAMHNSEQLPNEVKAWVDLWLQHRGHRKPLLVALLEPAREGATRTTEGCLQEAVRGGGVELRVESWTEVEGR